MVVLTQNKAFQYSLDLAKQYTLELIDEKDRIISTKWIEKLNNSNEIEDENLRDEYLKLLLFCLKCKRLVGQFKELPNVETNRLDNIKYKLNDIFELIIKEEFLDYGRPAPYSVKRSDKLSNLHNVNNNNNSPLDYIQAAIQSIDCSLWPKNEITVNVQTQSDEAPLPSSRDSNGLVKELRFSYTNKSKAKKIPSRLKERLEKKYVSVARKHRGHDERASPKIGVSGPFKRHKPEEFGLTKNERFVSAEQYFADLKYSPTGREGRIQVRDYFKRRRERQATPTITEATTSKIQIDLDRSLNETYNRLKERRTKINDTSPAKSKTQERLMKIYKEKLNKLKRVVRQPQQINYDIVDDIQNENDNAKQYFEKIKFNDDNSHISILQDDEMFTDDIFGENQLITKMYSTSSDKSDGLLTEEDMIIDDLLTEFENDNIMDLIGTRNGQQQISIKSSTESDGMLKELNTDEIFSECDSNEVEAFFQNYRNQQKIKRENAKQKLREKYDEDQAKIKNFLKYDKLVNQDPVAHAALSKSLNQTARYRHLRRRLNFSRAEEYEDENNMDLPDEPYEVIEELTNRSSEHKNLNSPLNHRSPEKQLNEIDKREKSIKLKKSKTKKKVEKPQKLLDISNVEFPESQYHTVTAPYALIDESFDNQYLGEAVIQANNNFSAIQDYYTDDEMPIEDMFGENAIFQPEQMEMFSQNHKQTKQPSYKKIVTGEYRRNMLDNEVNLDESISAITEPEYIDVYANASTSLVTFADNVADSEQSQLHRYDEVSQSHIEMIERCNKQTNDVQTIRERFGRFIRAKEFDLNEILNEEEMFYGDIFNENLIIGSDEKIPFQRRTYDIPARRRLEYESTRTTNVSNSDDKLDDITEPELVSGEIYDDELLPATNKNRIDEQHISNISEPEWQSVEISEYEILPPTDDENIADFTPPIDIDISLLSNEKNDNIAEEQMPQQQVIQNLINDIINIGEQLKVKCAQKEHSMDDSPTKTILKKSAIQSIKHRKLRNRYRLSKGQTVIENEPHDLPAFKRVFEPDLMDPIAYQQFEETRGPLDKSITDAKLIDPLIKSPKLRRKPNAILEYDNVLKQKFPVNALRRNRFTSSPLKKDSHSHEKPRLHDNHDLKELMHDPMKTPPQRSYFRRPEYGILDTSFNEDYLHTPLIDAPSKYPCNKENSFMSDGEMIYDDLFEESILVEPITIATSPSRSGQLRQRNNENVNIYKSYASGNYRYEILEKQPLSPHLQIQPPIPTYDEDLENIDDIKQPENFDLTDASLEHEQFRISPEFASQVQKLNRLSRPIPKIQIQPATPPPMPKLHTPTPSQIMRTKGQRQIPIRKKGNIPTSRLPRYRHQNKVRYETRGEKREIFESKLRKLPQIPKKVTSNQPPLSIEIIKKRYADIHRKKNLERSKGLTSEEHNVGNRKNVFLEFEKNLLQAEKIAEFSRKKPNTPHDKKMNDILNTSFTSNEMYFNDPLFNISADYLLSDDMLYDDIFGVESTVQNIQSFHQTPKESKKQSFENQQRYYDYASGKFRRDILPNIAEQLSTQSEHISQIEQPYLEDGMDSNEEFTTERLPFEQHMRFLNALENILDTVNNASQQQQKPPQLKVGKRNEAIISTTDLNTIPELPQKFIDTQKRYKILKSSGRNNRNTVNKNFSKEFPSITDESSIEVNKNLQFPFTTVPKQRFGNIDLLDKSLEKLMQYKIDAENLELVNTQNLPDDMYFENDSDKLNRRLLNEISEDDLLNYGEPDLIEYSANRPVTSTNYHPQPGILDESFSSEEYLSKPLVPGPKRIKLRKIENILDDEDMFIQDIFGDDETSVDEHEYYCDEKKMHKQRELERNQLYGQYASGAFRLQHIRPNLLTQQELNERSPKYHTVNQQRRSRYEFDSIISDRSNIEDEKYDFEHDEDINNIESPRARIEMSPIGLFRVPLHEAFKWLDEMVPQIDEPQQRRHKHITRREPIKKRHVQTKCGDETLIEYKIISPRMKKQKYIANKESISKFKKLHKSQSSTKKLFKNPTDSQLKVKKNTPESNLNNIRSKKSCDQFINSLNDKKLKELINDQLNQLSDNEPQSVRKLPSTNRGESNNTSRRAVDLKTRKLQGAIPKRKKSS